MPRNASFYSAFLVLPPDGRRAITATWDLCRAIDDSVDLAGPAADAAGHEAIRFWREELARCFEHGEPQTPEGRALQPHISRFDLPRQHFAEVIEGVEMDLVKKRYETFEELYEYCLR